MNAEPPITDGDPREAVAGFFARLGRLCAAVDFDATEPLFASDVASFGTRAAVVTGLDRLRSEQWEGIWPNIEGFRFDLDSVHGGGTGDLAWGMAPWTSTGFDERGAPFERPGRATVVMERRDGVWLVVHTHFSLAPGTPPRTHGRSSKGPAR